MTSLDCQRKIAVEVEHYTTTLDSLRALNDDWDSYGAGVIDPAVISAVQVFLRAVLAGRASVVPTRRGGVQIEVHEGGFDVEIELDGDRRAIDGFWATT